MFKPPDLSRSVAWIGEVEVEQYQKTLEKILALMKKDANKPINLLITSGGGHLEIAYSFHDLMTSVVKPKLNTLAAGEISSAAVILYLSATGTRYATPHTYFILHEFSRHYSHAEVTTPELSVCVQEHKELAAWYADMISKATKGRLEHPKVLEMMRANTLITVQEALKLGLVQEIIH